MAERRQKTRVALETLVRRIKEPLLDS